jgi:hypothetical protein
VVPDPDPTTALRRCLQRVGRGPGPWPVQPVAEVSRDGSTLLVALAVPMPGQLEELPVEPRVADDATSKGRRAAVPRDVFRWLREHPGRHFSDILAAMEGRGHSRTQAADALAKLVQLGLVEHTARGLPYRAAV